MFNFLALLLAIGISRALTCSTLGKRSCILDIHSLRNEMATEHKLKQTR